MAMAGAAIKLTLSAVIVSLIINLSKANDTISLAAANVRLKAAGNLKWPAAEMTLKQ
jgi:hypothetical protein